MTNARTSGAGSVGRIGSALINLRNKSNREFDKEELFLSLIFINHAASMFDAFLTSINRTKKVNIESNMKFGYDNNGVEINLKW